MRHLCDCRTTFARTSLSLIYSQCCREVFHFCCNWLAIQSYLSRKYVVFQNDGELIARGRQQVRDRFETLAMTLRPLCEEFYRIKFLNMFKFSRLLCATWRHMQGNYESMATVSRLLCDPTVCLQLLKKTVAVQ